MNDETKRIIRSLRLKKGFTQAELASIVGVSDKTVSKWESGRGLPDIQLIEPLSKALGISAAELMGGKTVVNPNKSGNALKSGFSVCPHCGNIVYSMGKALVYCCGEEIPLLPSEQEGGTHRIKCERVENEIFVSLDHPMEKKGFISFVAFVRGDRCEIVRLYPEQNAEARFFYRGAGIIYAYCTEHGLFKKTFNRFDD